jgi:tRNA(Ile)-lysidine synthase
LGYSGGPDSKALLYALLECGIKPHIAHVDHGWREESSSEAEAIREEARLLNCPFFSKRLEEKLNEDDARRARLCFFSSIFEGHQALLLAHHADDLAETVLKRVLEGAHLCHLGAMTPASDQFGMTIWRPLLSVRRSEIVEFLEERAIVAIDDSTNYDPKYLRARMRRELFPFLNKCFGKQSVSNLTLLSERASELKRYLDQKIEGVKIEKGPWGALADLTGMEKIEQRHLIQKMASQESIVLTRSVLETLLQWIEEGGRSKFLEIKTKKILVDKGRIWIA